MSLRKKFSQIKDLSGLKPDQKWEKTTKYDLLAEISSQNRLMQAQKLTTTERVDLFMAKIFNRVSPSLSKMVAGFLIIVMGSSLSMAAQASVPGETLWPVKRSMEKAELSLTFSPVKETEVHIKHVNKRLQEIDKILEEENGTPEKTVKKEKAIKQAVRHLEKDVNSVDSSLKIVKEEKKATEVVELVKKVATATKEVKKNIESKKDISKSDKVIGEALKDAQKVNDQVKKAAVDLAVEVHDEVVAAADGEKEAADKPETDVASSSAEKLAVSPEEVEAVKAAVAEIIASEIEELTEDINEVKEQVDVVEDEKLEELNVKNTEKEQVAIEEGTSDDDEEAIDSEDIGKLKEAPTEAAVKLDEAKVLLEEGALKDALSKVSESKELNDKSEVILEKLDELNEEEELSTLNTEELIEVVDEYLGNEDPTLPDELSNTDDSKPLKPAEEEVNVEASIIKEEMILEEEQASL